MDAISGVTQACSGIVPRPSTGRKAAEVWELGPTTAQADEGQCASEQPGQPGDAAGAGGGAALLGIVGLNDGSLLLAPSLTWSLSDEQTLDLGIFWYRGNEDAMFGDQDSQLYLRWYIHF